MQIIVEEPRMSYILSEYKNNLFKVESFRRPLMKTIALLLTGLFGLSAYAWDAKTEFTKNCATCHLIGGGDKIGPDLAGVTERRTEKWVVKYMSYPTGMMQGDPEEEGYEKADPIAAVLWEKFKPNIMAEQSLTEDQVKQMLAYIKAESKGKTPKGKILEVQKILKEKKIDTGVKAK